MFQKIIGYGPSTVVPSVVSFLMIYAYTRLLTPGAFGEFSLVFSAVLTLQTSLFYALPAAVTRFYPEAVALGRRDQFLAECYSLFYVLSLSVGLLIAVLAGVAGFSSPPRHSLVLWWLVIPLLVTRSAVALNQAVNRIDDRTWRYNLTECSHAILGLGLSLAFISLLGGTAKAVLLGQIAAAAVCACPNLPAMLSPLRLGVRATDHSSLGRLVRFSLPLIAVDVTVCLLAFSDRFLLGTLGGTQMLGIYAVAYNLVDRPTTLICTAVSTATFPLAVQALQHQGRDAGRIQAGKNGAVLLTLAIPACVGLALTSPYVAAVLVGPDFRAGVAALIPVMCVTALLRGLSVHFIDHAFHLAGSFRPALWVYGPAALAMIVLNALLIPRYGMFGAAWAGLICQAGSVAVGWVVGRRSFPIWLPPREVGKIIIAVVPMALALSAVAFPLNWSGLLQAVCTGATVFAIGAALLDIGGLRSLGSTMANSLQRQR
jgi:O-antigen/teichoic acid export membrane protein